MAKREIWKDIENYDTYMISTYGRVKSKPKEWIAGNSVKRKHYGKILKLQNNVQGYKTIRLYKEQKGKSFRIHRLVAEAFISKPSDYNEMKELSYHGYTVNHKDGNKENNHVDNLEWMTNRQNIQHSYDTGLNEKNREKTRNLRARKVIIYKDNQELKFDYIKDAADFLDCHSSTISRTIKKNILYNGIWGIKYG
jgi:hypothetical protein